MWADRRSLAAVALVAPVVIALLLGACSSGDEQGLPVERLAAIGDVVEVGGATATVEAVEVVEATAEVYAAEGDRVAVEVSVCGEADDVAGLWTLRLGDDVLEPVPLPPGALPEEHRPTFDFTASPGPDGCRVGWVAWDLAPDADGGAGVVVWEGDPEVGWPTDDAASD